MPLVVVVKVAPQLAIGWADPSSPAAPVVGREAHGAPRRHSPAETRVYFILKDDSKELSSIPGARSQIVIVCVT